MSPRTGRPKIDNPKSIEVKVRFDKETNTKLVNYCSENKMTKSDAIRKGVDLLVGQEDK